MPNRNPISLDVLFSLQLLRIKDKLFPHLPPSGPKKPSLEEQEAKLLGLDTDDDTTDE